MILIDTSIWVDFFRAGDPTLVVLLNDGRVLTHPSVIGELAVGNLQQRGSVLSALEKLPVTTIASDSEVLEFIDQHRLYGLGIGYVDCQLLAAVVLTPGTSFWTRDKRLMTVAERLGLASSFLDRGNGAHP